MEIINKKLEAHREYNHKHKDIINAKNKIYYQANKEMLLKKNKEYRLTSPESYRLMAKKSRDKRKDKKAISDKVYYIKQYDIVRGKQAEYYKENKEVIKDKTKQYRITHRDEYLKACKDYYYKHKVRLRRLQNEYRKLRCQEDMSFRLSRILSNRVWKALNNHLNMGKIKSNKLYGIDVDAIAQKLIKELPQDFEFGKYHADHIIPIACFDLNDAKQLKECFKPENYQWLLAQDNLNKSDKILPEHEPLYLELKNRFDLKK
jgi:hypothetical protein